MTRWVLLSASADKSDVAALAAHPDVRHCSAGADLPGSVGGPGAVWDLTTTAELASLPGVPADVDAVPLLPVGSRTVDLEGPRIKRTLLLTVAPGTPDEVVRRFEHDTMAMPDHISSIRSWALSRVDTSVTGASRRWTHVWEQEFVDADGLNGEYLLHPYHWTYVDNWFDSESPRHIVEPAIAHLYRTADGPVLGPDQISASSTGSPNA